MDDRYAYMLNALWARHYDLGRVIRFRHVQRGRQAIAYEVLTAEQREYTVYLFPPGQRPESLGQVAGMLATLDTHRFSVVPMVKSKDDAWTVDGPQGQRMMVGLNTDGQLLAAESWTEHGLSQLGLRLGWMHRLLDEQWPLESHPAAEPLAAALRAAWHRPAAELPHRLPKLSPAHMEQLLSAVREAAPTGWCHGDVQPAALLVDHDRQIRTVVDWSLAHAGVPLEDLVDAFTHWCIAPDGTVGAEHARALLEAYRSLRAFENDQWLGAVQSWCAWRIIHAIHDLSPLPRGFGQILADPAALAQAIELCAAK